jgi:uncharacterized membrane protein YfcA
VLSSQAFLIIAVCTVATSIVSALMGMAGGIMLLSIIASLTQTIYIVPLYSSIQLISNTTRLLLFFKHIHWNIIRLFLLGLIPGSLCGIYLFQMLPKDVIKLLMGVFILLAVFVPQSKTEIRTGIRIFFGLGIFSGILSVLLGTPGPLLAPFFVRNDIIKEELIATKAVCQTLSHILNIFLYGFIGINILAHWNILVVLGFAAILGTLAGKKILTKISDRYFLIAFKTILIIIALRMVVIQLMKIWV